MDFKSKTISAKIASKNLRMKQNMIKRFARVKDNEYWRHWPDKLGSGDFLVVLLRRLVEHFVLEEIVESAGLHRL